MSVIFNGWLVAGIVTRPTAAMLGEAGPEAVLPLRSGIGAGLNLSINFAAGSITLGGTGNTSDTKAMFREFAETIAYEVQRAINAEHRRSAVV